MISSLEQERSASPELNASRFSLRANESSSPDLKSVKIEAAHLHAFFGKVQALNDVSMQIPQNSVVSIIGPSGCGKSTFLRCLNRMHEVAGGTTRGKVLLDGVDIYSTDAVRIRRRVGMVFQTPTPVPTTQTYAH